MSGRKPERPKTAADLIAELDTIARSMSQRVEVLVGKLAVVDANTKLQDEKVRGLVKALEENALVAQSEYDHRAGVYTDEEPLQAALQGIVNQAHAALDECEGNG